MGFPTNVTTVKITGRLLVSSVDGHRPTTERVAVPAKLQVEFTPEVIKVPAPGAQAGPTTFYRPDGDLPDMVRGVIDAEGYLCTPDPNNPAYPMFRSVRLMATDDDAISVKDWTWRVTVKTTAGKVVESYSIAVPKAAALSGLDLTNLAPVPSTPGYGLPQAEAAAAAAAQDAQAAADAASRAESQIGATVTEGEVVGDDLILRRSNGETINAGDVRGPQGLPGPNSIPTDEAVAEYIGTDATNTQTAGDARWVTNEGVDNTVSALFSAPDSEVQAAADNRYIKRNEMSVSVRDFGAVGDGATDDTAAFQSAIEYAHGTFGQGGEVVITEGDYWFAGTAIMRDRVSLRGVGWPIIRRKFGDVRYSLFAVLSEGRTGYGSGASNWSASGIEFRASFKAGEERSACAFAMHHGQNIEIHGNRFIEMHAKGHVVDLNACDNVNIHDNVFMGMQKLDGSGVAECIQFDQSKKGSLSHPDAEGSYDGLMSRNITIENNKFLPLTVDGVWYPASNIGGMHTTREGVYYENLKILNNYVEDPILVTSHSSRGNIHLEGAKGVIIRGNKFKSTRGGNTKLISARTVVVGNPVGQDPNIEQPVTTIPAQGCIDVLIENNEFEGFDGELTSEYMIHIWGIEGSESVMTGIDLKDNKFRDNFSTGTGSDPIRVQNVAECTIDSTKCRGKNSRVFYAIGIKGFSARNNISEWSEVQPFWIENCSRRVQFQGNEWSNALNSPRAKGCTDLIVSGNNATSPRAGVFGFVLEACERFYVGPNNFSTAITGAAAIALSGSANTKGTINSNNCYGYTTAVQGTSVGVTIGTNPN